MSLGLLEAVHLTLIGMGVVFAGLIALYLVMMLIGHSLGREKTGGSGAGGRVAPAPTSSPVPGHGPDGPGTPGPAAAEPVAEGEAAPDIVAVISGAVYATLGPGIRVRSIRVGRSATGASPSLWAIAGRQELMMPETAFRRRAGERLIPARGEDARG